MVRNYTFDIIRILAMVLIIIMHSPIPEINTPGIVLSTISFMTAPGIGLFFMISGALLLGNNLPQTDFLKHRFSKVVWPTLVWTIIYLIVNCINEPLSAKELAKTICSIPFEKQGHGVLWFMYTLAGLYLLTPVLSRWLKSAQRKDVEFYLFLWAITLLYPYLNLVININTDETGILYYFTGYLGYYLLGYYLKQYVLPQTVNRTKVIGCILAIMLCLLIVFATKKVEPNVKIGDLFWYLSMPVAIMATAYFLLFSKIHIFEQSKNLIFKMSSLSFGVYLCHILVMRSFLWNIKFIHDSGPLLSIPIVATLTIVLSWILVYLLSKLPFSKFVIGV